MYGIIYKATNLINGKVYIGQTIRTLDDRITAHYQRRNDGTYFHNALKKYRKEDFSWEIIDSAETTEELSNKEVYWISYYDSFNNKEKGYNSTSGGELSKHLSDETKEKISKSNNGKRISEEHKQKLREAFTGRYVSSETRKKMSEALSGENNPMYGKHHSEETKEKLRVASTGREATQKMRETSSKIHKGKIVSEETKRKLSESKTGMKLPPFTEEHKQKLRNANIGANNPQAKRIVCVETGIKYGCIQDAAKQTGIHYKKISRCCNEQIENADGYTFKFLNETK